jgi:hypothetical protein
MTFELEKKNEAEACKSYFDELGYRAVRKGCKVSINESNEKKGNMLFKIFVDTALIGR